MARPNAERERDGLRVDLDVVGGDQDGEGADLWAGEEAAVEAEGFGEHRLCDLYDDIKNSSARSPIRSAASSSSAAQLRQALRQD